MRSNWVVIPVKSLESGKTRLADVLSVKERKELIQKLLKRVINATRRSKFIDHCLVVSNDLEILKIARKNKAEVFLENEPIDLNNAIVSAIEHIKKHAYNKLLIIHSDLPLISSTDIDKLINSCENPPCIVIASDRSNCGTNAMVVEPIDDFKFQFGQNSYKKHVEQAEKNGYTVVIYNHINTALDLDLPEDLVFYRSHYKKNSLRRLE